MFLSNAEDKTGEGIIIGSFDLNNIGFQPFLFYPLLLRANIDYNEQYPDSSFVRSLKFSFSKSSLPYNRHPFGGTSTHHVTYRLSLTIHISLIFEDNKSI